MIRRIYKIIKIHDGDYCEYFTFYKDWAYFNISGLNEGCPYDNRSETNKIDTGQKLKGGYNYGKI